MITHKLDQLARTSTVDWEAWLKLPEVIAEVEASKAEAHLDALKKCYFIDGEAPVKEVPVVQEEAPVTEESTAEADMAAPVETPKTDAESAPPVETKRGKKHKK